MSEIPSSTSWNVLHIDDVREVLDLVKEALEGLDPIGGRGFSVQGSTSFEDGLELLQQGNHDVFILDVRAGDVGADVLEDAEAGRILLKQIQAARFVPVVFYTGLPLVVKDDLEAAPLIQVVQKGGKMSVLRDAVSGAVLTGLPSLRRGLEQHLTEVLREYMWGFVAEHHDAFSAGEDQGSYLHLLLRRLSRSIPHAVSQQLAAEVGFELGVQEPDGKVPPIRYYVMPPLDEAGHITGDIYRADLSAYAPGLPFHPSSPDDGGAEGKTPDLSKFWVLITPVCDLALRQDGSCKADNVILARAERLDEQKEYGGWKANQSNTRRKSLENLLKNKRSGGQPSRYHYLPGAFDLPHLIVDFQQILTVPREALTVDGVVRVATLDEPYGAELVSRFTNYINRIGSPDLDINSVIDSL